MDENWKKFWLSNSDYAKFMDDMVRNSNFNYNEVALIEIAINLHEIAQQLAEMNGYVPYQYNMEDTDENQNE